MSAILWEYPWYNVLYPRRAVMMTMIINLNYKDQDIYNWLKIDDYDIANETLWPTSPPNSTPLITRFFITILNYSCPVAITFSDLKLPTTIRFYSSDISNTSIYIWSFNDITCLSFTDSRLPMQYRSTATYKLLMQNVAFTIVKI